MVKKRIIVSGINITHGGPLSILHDCLNSLKNNFLEEYEIFALVAYKHLIDIPGIQVVEFPQSKISYFHKAYYEYCAFKKLSRKLKPYLWLSLSNITPNVESTILVSYFHNAAPFYVVRFRDLLLEPKLVFFNVFYKIFYRINALQNNFIVVQANWLKHKFSKLLETHNRIIVAYPDLFTSTNVTQHTTTSPSKEREIIFFYPSFPRVFKNFEVIGEAVNLLNKKSITTPFKVYFTLSGDENAYSRFIKKKYASIKNIEFIGLLPREQIFSLYEKVDALIFPSKLETWGLPISEFKPYKKPIFAADLPYGRETVGNYHPVYFFNPDKSEELANLMFKLICNQLTLSSDKTLPDSSLNDREAVYTWQDLFHLIIGSQNEN